MDSLKLNKISKKNWSRKVKISSRMIFLFLLIFLCGLTSDINKLFFHCYCRKLQDFQSVICFNLNVQKLMSNAFKNYDIPHPSH